ncbi:hypothetical protein A6X21_07615 [Planctopirus hydrillae]|uniref:Uncharacterized protein n=1 Tax=Planctopirus hydrillae TaxID=1841610 RepID=A0A1C3E8Z9_9PLAN|nr:hypothetical protein A6X21_07615 [Planctopirus hydrillae]
MSRLCEPRFVRSVLRTERGRDAWSFPTAESARKRVLKTDARWEKGRWMSKKLRRPQLAGISHTLSDAKTRFF